MKPLRANDGFSLIEVLAALTIFTIAAAGLAATSIGTVKANNLSKQTSTASAMIQDKIEQLRALDPSTNPADLQAGNHNDPLNPLTPLGRAGGIFTRSWVVTANTPKIGLAQVTVTVTWSSAGKSRSTNGVTYVCRTATCS